MKRTLVGLFVVALSASTAFAGSLKIDEKEDVIVVDYTGSGAATVATTSDEAAEAALEDQARAAAQQRRAQEGGSKENSRKRGADAGSPRRAAAKTVSAGESGE